jgi:hypothetical protein
MGWKAFILTDDDLWRATAISMRGSSGHRNQPLPTTILPNPSPVNAHCDGLETADGTTND